MVGLCSKSKNVILVILYSMFANRDHLHDNRNDLRANCDNEEIMVLIALDSMSEHTIKQL